MADHCPRSCKIPCKYIVALTVYDRAGKVVYSEQIYEAARKEPLKSSMLLLPVIE